MLLENIFEVNPANLIENVEACTNKNVLININNPHLTISFTIPSELNPSSGSIIFLANLVIANNPSKVRAIAITPFWNVTKLLLPETELIISKAFNPFKISNRESIRS